MQRWATWDADAGVVREIVSVEIKDKATGEILGYVLPDVAAAFIRGDISADMVRTLVGPKQIGDDGPAGLAWKVEA